MSSDIKIIKDLYNNWWKSNWGFTPITDEEAAEIAGTIKFFGHEETSLLAYYDDTPVGMYIALPDINQIIKQLDGKLGIKGILKLIFGRKKITRSRAFIIGVNEQPRNTGIEKISNCGISF